MRPSHLPWLGGLLVAGLVLAACVPDSTSRVESPTGPAPPAQDYDPARPRAEVPGFVPSLGFDAIRPIYQPEFTTAQSAPLVPDELVIGIELRGQAKAYPVTVLRFREMVNDELRGIPILVTW